MKDLPIVARLYVGAVLAAGAVVLALFAPHTIANPVVFLALLVCSSLASALKVTLPPQEKRAIERRSTQDLAAYEAYRLARYYGMQYTHRKVEIGPSP